MNKTTKRLLVITATLLCSNGLAIGLARSKPDAASATGQSARDSLSQINRVINDLDQQVAENATSSGLDLLARLQLSKGRLTGGADSYARAQSAVEQSLAIAPRNQEALALDLEIKFSNHDFAGALSGSKSLLSVAPKQLSALTVNADANRELGNYPAATAAQRVLEEVAPNAAPVLARRSRLAFLLGDSTAAIDFASRAETRAANSGLLGETLAFYSAFAGQLAFDLGDYTKAGEYFDRALTLAPGDRVATLGAARVLAAKGKVEAATKLLAELTDRFPDPGALALLGDLYGIAGDSRAAEETFALVDAIAALATSNRQIYDRELSLFYANHDRRLPESLKLARAEIEVRKDIYAYDTLAWAEYQSGHLDLAEQAAQQALRFDTQDARIHFHAGMIAAAKDKRSEAKALLSKALAISPHFEVVGADVARATLRDLEKNS